MGEGDVHVRVAAARAGGLATDPASVDGRREADVADAATVTRSAYAAAGVDVAAAERAVELMKERLGATHGSEVLAGLGGFGAAVALPAGMRQPVLVSATDGVGTKTEIARLMRRRGTIGIDLVAMCADDVVCLGARPLLFLDYVAVGRLKPHAVAELVDGVARGCEVAGCSLVGGETAEHPGLMAADAFDLAGFCVGVAERADLLDGSTVRVGDVLLGLASSGLHANGYSLVRATMADHDLDLAEAYVELVGRVLGPAESDVLAGAEPDNAAATLGEVLLAPTRIYARDVLALRGRLRSIGGDLGGIAHVTGGALPGNVPRMLPDEAAAIVDVATWRMPSIFRVIAALADVGEAELRATLNAGVGMVVALEREFVDLAVATLADRGVAAWPIGRVASRAEAGGRAYVEERSSE